MHRLLDDGRELAGERSEIDLVAHAGPESGERPGRVVLTAVEAPVDDRLDASAQRLEERRDQQRGDDDRDVALLAGGRAEERLKPNDAAQVPAVNNRCQKIIGPGVCRN